MKLNKTNLRFADGQYRPVGKLCVATSLKACVPLGILGGKALYGNGRWLFVDDGTINTALDSNIRCAAITGDNSIIVMTDSGLVNVKLEDNRMIYHALSRYAAVRLMAVAGTPVSVDVEKRALTSDFSDRRFKDSDTKSLTKDLCDAYRRLCATASGSGRALQPVLARYRLIDNRGQTVFVSPILFLSHPDGAQCADYKELFRLEGTTINGYTLEANTWGLELVIPAAVYDEIARLDISMTPLFHPFDTSVQSNIYMGTGTSQTSPVARIALPGMERNTGGAYGGRIVREAYARMDALERTVASIHKPFDGTRRTVKVALATSAEPMEDTAAIKRELSKRVQVYDSTFECLSFTGAFSATKVADSGSTLMWSGLRLHRRPAYFPGIFAADEGEEARWIATVAVRFSDGRGISTTEVGYGGFSGKLGAILTYPSADAREMSICLEAYGRFYTGTFPLTPDQSGRYAIYFSPGLRQIELTEADSRPSFDYEDPSESVEGLVAFTDRNFPPKLKAWYDGREEFSAICGHKAMNQAWDFGRSRFLGVKAGAVLSLAISASGALSVNKLADRGSLRPDSLVCADDGGIYVALSTGIYCLTPTGTFRPFECTESYTGLGWSFKHRELWALTEDGRCIVFGEKGNYLRDDNVPLEFFNGGGATFAICADGPAVLGEEQESDVKVYMRQEDVKKAEFDAYGGIRDGELRVVALSTVGGREFTLRKLKLTGDCAGPVTVPLLCRRYRHLDLIFEGTVSPEYRICA